MRHLGIFAKYWQPGQVKTRLAATLGSEAAAAIYRRFVQVLLDRLHTTADRRTLVGDPAEQLDLFRQMAGSQWQVRAQTSGDLGRRMQHFFADAQRDGSRRTVLIGSDSPTLPVERIERAFELLRDHQVVLGPSDDGGYYLIGLAGPPPPLFTGIRWGSSQVWRQTCQRLTEHPCRWTALEPWYDVDRWSDLVRLQQELASVEDAALQSLRDDITHYLNSRQSKVDS